MDEQLVAYIKAARSHGMNNNKIRDALLAKGWNEKKVDKVLTQRKIIPIAFLSIFIIVLLFSGLKMMGGTPLEKRNRELDLKRVEDLRAIAWDTEYYYESNDKLPATLSENSYIFRNFTDPESNQPYKYSVLFSSQYQLCGTFATDQSKKVISRSERIKYEADPLYFIFANHGSGEQCEIVTIPEHVLDSN